MRLRRLISGIVATVLAVSGRVWAYEWPLEAPRVAVGFGQLVDGRLAVGVDVVSPETAVRPIEGGEVVFRFDPARNRGSLPRGIGAHLVIQHTERVRSVYAHMEAGSLTRADVISPGQIVGSVGETGAAVGRMLGLSIQDMETTTYLNPLTVMPVLTDRQAPVVGRVYLRRSDSAAPVEMGRVFRGAAGPAEILVEAFDLREDVGYRWPVAPHVLSLWANGRQTAAVRFDTIRSATELLLEGTPPRGAAALYREPWLFRLGEIQLQRGETRLEILVQDLVGNESTREVVLSIGG